jgi:plasmid maintenance system antidote protein VapI
MELENYLKKYGWKPTPWAQKHNISPAVINRYIHKKGGLNIVNALKIERACNEEVTVADLLARYKYTIAA